MVKKVIKGKSYRVNKDVESPCFRGNIFEKDDILIAKSNQSPDNDGDFYLNGHYINKRDIDEVKE